MLRLYISGLIEYDSLAQIYPPERKSEIEKAKTPDSKAQKYSVWRLLERAVSDTFAKPLTAYNLTKTQSGKWQSDGFYFSLSHSQSVVAVAISDSPVGVDIETKTFSDPERTAKKILTPTEMQTYYCSEDKPSFVIRKWCEKESIFKMRNLPQFSPCKTDTDSERVITNCVCIDNKSCTVCVATASQDDTLEIFENGEYL